MCKTTCIADFVLVPVLREQIFYAADCYKQNTVVFRYIVSNSTFYSIINVLYCICEFTGLYMQHVFKR
jgi:hypothetical protein